MADGYWARPMLRVLLPCIAPSQLHSASSCIWPAFLVARSKIALRFLFDGARRCQSLIPCIHFPRRGFFAVSHHFLSLIFFFPLSLVLVGILSLRSNPATFPFGRPARRSGSLSLSQKTSQSSHPKDRPARSIAIRRFGPNPDSIGP